MSLPTLLKPKEVCDFLSISRNTLYHLVHSKRIPFVKSGGILRFREDQLLAWLQEHSAQLEKTK